MPVRFISAALPEELPADCVLVHFCDLFGLWTSDYSRWIRSSFPEVYGDFHKWAQINQPGLPPYVRGGAQFVPLSNHSFVVNALLLHGQLRSANPHPFLTDFFPGFLSNLQKFCSLNQISSIRINAAREQLGGLTLNQLTSLLEAAAPELDFEIYSFTPPATANPAAIRTETVRAETPSFAVH